MVGLHKVSVVLQHQLDLAVRHCAQLDVGKDPLGKRALAQPAEVLDDIPGLQAHGDGRVEGVGGKFVLVDVLWPADRLADRDQEVVRMPTKNTYCW